MIGQITALNKNKEWNGEKNKKTSVLLVVNHPGSPQGGISAESTIKIFTGMRVRSRKHKNVQKGKKSIHNEI